MHANRSVTFSAAAVALALTGCGRVDGIPIQDTATAFAQAICPKAYSCCTTQQLMSNAAAGTTEAECETNTAQRFEQQLQTMQSSQNAGRARYDQTQVDACLAAIRAASCTDLTAIHSLTQLPACDSTFATPLVAAGGHCQQDYECIAGVCQRPPGSFDGVCVAGAAAGASCGTDRCGPSLTCDGAGTMDTGDDVCVAPQDDGAACTDALSCKSGNCSGSGSGGKTCQPPSAPQCFYGGGCSTAGGRPGPGAVAAALLLLVPAVRRRRPARACRA